MATTTHVFLAQLYDDLELASPALDTHWFTLGLDARFSDNEVLTHARAYYLWLLDQLELAPDPTGELLMLTKVPAPIYFEQPEDPEEDPIAPDMGDIPEGATELADRSAEWPQPTYTPPTLPDAYDEPGAIQLYDP